jgi:adenylylsulfate kinase
MSFCLWITGLPGSGKTTIVKQLERLLAKRRVGFVTLNMDLIRKTVTPEAEYTERERGIVYRSLVLIAQLLVEHSNKCVLIDATGNRREFRALARNLIPEFAEVYVKCPLEICQSRESLRKSQMVRTNLYRNAINGRLKGHLPGIAVPYEPPLNPEVELDSAVLSPKEAAVSIEAYVRSRWAEQTNQR